MPKTLLPNRLLPPKSFWFIRISMKLSSGHHHHGTTWTSPLSFSAGFVLGSSLVALLFLSFFQCSSIDGDNQPESQTLSSDILLSMEPSSTAVVPSISYTPLPANVTAWQSALNRTVLVIFYNNADIPNEFSVSLLRAIYGRIFMQVVIAAPEARPRLGVVQLEGIDGHKPIPWHFYYAALPHLFSAFPHAEGLLWSNDDVVINYWNLASANKSRVWMPAGNPFVNYRWVDLNCCRSDDWTPDWSRSPETRATMRQALSLIPPELRAQYEASTEARAGQYTKHIADLVYYPRRMWETLSVELIPAFFTARVHSELAVVAMLLCIDGFSHWDPTLNDMVYLWTEEERRQAMRMYNTSASALHPWKLTYRAYGRLLLLHMARGDPSLKRLLPLFNFK